MYPVSAMRAFRRPTAIGFLRADISSYRESSHGHDIRRLAKRMGYELLFVVRFEQDSDAVPDPLEPVLGLVRAIHADAVIVPDLAHVEDQPRPICDVCDLITVYPEQTWTAVASAFEGNPSLGPDPGKIISKVRDALSREAES